LPDGEGEIAGVSYRIQGSGPPLVLMPLLLSPSQLEPLQNTYIDRYSAWRRHWPFVGGIPIYPL
jgi:hypothetical protein